MHARAYCGISFSHCLPFYRSHWLVKQDCLWIRARHGLAWIVYSCWRSRLVWDSALPIPYVSHEQLIVLDIDRQRPHKQLLCIHRALCNCRTNFLHTLILSSTVPLVSLQWEEKFFLQPFSISVSSPSLSSTIHFCWYLNMSTDFRQMKPVLKAYNYSVPCPAASGMLFGKRMRQTVMEIWFNSVMSSTYTWFSSAVCNNSFQCYFALFLFIDTSRKLRFFQKRAYNSPVEILFIHVQNASVPVQMDIQHQRV